MEQTECSKTLAYKIQTPGNYPEENIHFTVLFAISNDSITGVQKNKVEAVLVLCMLIGMQSFSKTLLMFLNVFYFM
jgi:hypothetical protein